MIAVSNSNANQQHIKFQFRTLPLSGYPSALYEEELRGWRRHDIPMPNHSGQGKTKGKRVECVWVKRAK
jgi:hypothetical protein